MESTNPYLENEVKSATPQRLRLMLIEGAIRFALLAKQHASRQEAHLAQAARGRCRAVLAELLDSIDGESEVSDNMRAVYALTLTEFVAKEAIDPEAALDELLNVLTVERDTWQLVCEQLPELPAELRIAREQSHELTSNEAAAILDSGLSENEDSPKTSPAVESSGGFCLDA